MPALNLDNPNDLAKAAKAKEIVESTQSGLPVPSIPPDTHVDLTGFFFNKDFIRTAVVQELTGEHEEQLARAIQANNMFHFMDVLLQCGVQQLGDLGPAETKRNLKNLLVGDRDALVLAIRKATYGGELEILEWICPSCQREMDIILNLDEEDQVKVVPWDNPKDQTFEVDLSKGARAVVRLNNGTDQQAMYEDLQLTDAERNSILLGRIVETVTDEHGKLHVMAAEPQYPLRMRIADRHAILKKLSELRPGPRYNEVTFEHEECGNEVTLALGVRDLFRDLFLYL